ncbi:sodium:proton antiporter [Teredinibacter franksiae]|uniref:sodium:proton antiporter n=1 Tax=Teredinibacter franksiae TaxID=2761453 RepID=UPI0028ABB823|nr:sodium:proton antiporter [Teredinibacter franksiae]
MIFDNDELARAIFFFGDKGLVAKEMHYSEFEAVLDNYVPSMEWAGRTAKAVFLEIDSKMRIRTCVFFTVGFTKKGEVEGSWNIPLDQLARNAIRGPDLGAGPIRLVCESQCPIQYFRGALWNPELRAGKNQLQMLTKAVVRNKLAIQFRDGPDAEIEAPSKAVDAQLLEKKISQELRKEYAREYRDHMAQLLKDQRLRTATIASDSDKSIASLKVEQSNRIEEYRSLINEKSNLLAEEKVRNQTLKDTIDGQAKKIEGLREYFEHKLEKVEGQGADVVQALRENYQAETTAKIESATIELKEMLQMREVELMYRNEQESQLRDEIARLRQEHQALLGSGGNEILGKMTGKGISFVSYQPGAGHITIPTDDVGAYMENPVAYAAAQCGVHEDHYSAWLAHYQAPVCTSVDSDGNICSENVHRVSNPADFHSGDQDRCSVHKEIKGASKLKVVSG